MSNIAESSLVVYGASGKRALYTAEDFSLPREKVLEIASEKKIAWFEKQWDAVRQFYLNRLLKEAKLQQLSKEEFGNAIFEAVKRRYEKDKEYRREKSKRKRGRTTESINDDEKSDTICLTNFITLEDLLQLTSDEKEELVEVLLEQFKEIGEVLGVNQALDTIGPIPEDPNFDDRVGLIITYKDTADAVKAVVKTNGQIFDGRQVVCTAVKYVNLEDKTISNERNENIQSAVSNVTTKEEQPETIFSVDDIEGLDDLE